MTDTVSPLSDGITDDALRRELCFLLNSRLLERAVMLFGSWCIGVALTDAGVP